MPSSLFVLAATTPPFFPQVVAIIVISALIAYVSFRIGLVPIVGFLLAGVLIGPSLLGIVEDPEVIEAAGEVGVILLLFTIGLEFSLERLARIRRLIFVGGGLQVALIIAAVTGVLLLFGVDWRTGFFTGSLLALSSTAVVMKLLADRGETNTRGGQVTLGILIFQDLAVVALALLIPMLGGGGGSALDVVRALGTAGLIIVAVLVLARRVMPPILEAVARTCSAEIFLLSVVAICLGTAYITSLAGVSLSLGAFLAGLLVSESRFSDQAFGEILPLQILFSAVFFVSVGLLLDVGALVQNFPLVLAMVTGTLLLKLLTTGLSVRALGAPFGTVAFASLMLAQVGEFSLVLEQTGREAGLSPLGMGETGVQAFIGTVVLLMVLTPFLAQAAAWSERRFSERTRRRQGEQMVALASQPQAEGEHNPFASLGDHVIVAGYGSAGRKLVRSLEEAQVPYLILTLSPDGSNEAEQEGRPVMRGDYARLRTLSQAGIQQARALVVADDEMEMSRRVISVARNLNPGIHILARTRDGNGYEELTAAGADNIVSEEFASVAHLLKGLLGRYDFGEDQIVRYIHNLHTASKPSGASTRQRTARLSEAQLASSRCSHTVTTQAVIPSASGCEECLKLGDTWVHLRLCMACGHVGCCDSSKNKHATQHFHTTDHPIIKSFQPGEDWAWCYVDKAYL